MKDKKTKHKQKAVRISFYKKVTRWYAEVPQHTEGQNLMVAGADYLCEIMAAGKKRVTVEFVADAALPPPNTIMHLIKEAQTGYGATYRICGQVFVRTKPTREEFRLPPTCWLCNVTRTVCGGYHPDTIDIISVSPNDEPPYGGTPPKKQ